VPLQNYRGERGHAQPNGHGVEQCRVTGDQSGFIETLHAPTDLRRGEIDDGAERGVGGVAVAL